MVQIIEGARPPSLAQRLNQGVGKGLDIAAQFYQQHQQKKLMNEENEAAKQLGINLSGISDPKMRQQIIMSSLQGQNLQNTELLKQQGKRSQQQEKMDYLSRLFEPNKSQGQGESQGMQQGQPGQSRGFDVSQLSDEDIAEANAMDPNMGRALSHAKDVALRENRENNRLLKEEKRHEEELDYRSFKDNKDYIEKVLTGLENYKRDKIVLDQMQKITNKGTLPKPMGVSLLNKLGIPLGVLENPDAEQFDKLSTELVKNIQGTFGSRILQSEVQLFMRSIPTLMNSAEGQKKLINQWQILNEGKKIYYDAYKDIKKENPKRLPRDLHEQVLERSEAKLELLANEFKKMNEPPIVMMRGPDGKIRNVPREMIEQAIQAGGELLE